MFQLILTGISQENLRGVEVTFSKAKKRACLVRLGASDSKEIPYLSRNAGLLFYLTADSFKEKEFIDLKIIC